MTGNMKRRMRKVAVTGLMLMGLALGGLGAVGCDVPGGAELARALSLDGASVFQVMDASAASDVNADSARIIHNGPPRAKIWNNPPRR
jgi:hypothetical protein